MKTTALVTLLCATALCTNANAASTSLSITVVTSGVPSTAVSCPLAPLYSAPLAIGSQICAITVTPSNWTGTLTLSGTNASSFALSGTNLVVDGTALVAGTYAVTITATP